jgi:hypothetical protein
MQGTVLQVGAHGEDVGLLRDKLVALGVYNPSDMKFYPYFSEYDYFDAGLQMAVEDYYRAQYSRYKNLITIIGYSPSIPAAVIEEISQLKLIAARSENDYIVDSVLWDYLGLHKNETLEQEFWSGTKGNDIIKVTIKNGNNIVIDYFPTILICGTDLTQTEKTSIADAIRDGFMAWVGNEYEIQGVNGVSVSVNYKPTRLRTTGDPDAETLAKANIIVDMNGSGASMVTTTVLPFGWSTGNAPTMFLNLKKQYSKTNWQNSIKMTAMHEFGHVLGLFDAYRNAPLTMGVANDDRANEDDVMLNFAIKPNQIVYGYDIVMVLYAFKNNQLQNFDNGSLFGVKSEIYSRIDIQKLI